MDKTSWLWLCAGSLVFLGGCSSLPKAKIYYYLPVSTLTVELDRVVGCDKSDHIRVADSITTSVSNEADTKGKRYAFDLTKQSSQFSDSDVTFALTKDGRISSVNATSTGQGGAIIKTIGLMAATAAVAFRGGDVPFTAACATIKSGNDGKPVTIVYKQTFKGTSLAAGKLEKMTPDAESSYFAEAVAPVLGVPFVKISDLDSLKAPIGPAESGASAAAVLATNRPKKDANGNRSPGVAEGQKKSDMDQKQAPVGEAEVGTSAAGAVESPKEDVIYARSPRIAKVLVAAAGGSKYISDANPIGDTSIGEVSVVLAGGGSAYEIPVLKPSVFGYKKVSATFDDNGVLTTIQYASNTGAVSSLDAYGALLTERAGVDAAKAKAINDKTDIEVANRRRILCATGSPDCK